MAIEIRANIGEEGEKENFVVVKKLEVWIDGKNIGPLEIAEGKLILEHMSSRIKYEFRIPS